MSDRPAAAAGDRPGPVPIEPAPGQESVWAYPRPPAVVASGERIRVVHRGIVLADSTATIRVLETSQPPTYYVPAADVAMEHLRRSPTRTVCEWKGVATYWSLHLEDVGDVADVADVAWGYEHPTPRFTSITGYLAFYPRRLDECSVDGEVVDGNAGEFYGGWITSRIVGPFKGAPGTLHW